MWNEFVRPVIVVNSTKKKALPVPQTSHKPLRDRFRSQGLNKCKFPRRLVEISCGLQVEYDRPFMMSQKEFVFLNTFY